MSEGCAVCGGPLPPSKTRRPRVICNSRACMRAVRVLGAKRSSLRQVRRRQALPAPTEWRCPQCGETKPLTPEYWYVDARGPSGEVLRYARWCKSCKRAYQRARAAKRSPAHVRALERKRQRSQERLAAMSSDELAVMRERWRKQSREQRRRNPERTRAARRRYWLKLKRDPSRHARYLENRRMEDRSRREQNGTPLEEQRRLSTARMPPDKQRRLPAAPLAEFVEGVVTRTAESENHTDEGKAREAVMQRLGLTDRSLRAWRRGERRTVQFDVVDRALTATGTPWWQVYPADRYPEVAAVLGAV